MSRFILYKPTKKDVAEAFARSQKLGVLSNSVTRGSGRMVGFLGEVSFERLHPNAIYVGDKSYTHDYEISGLRIDVKAKSCSSRPMLHYSASVLVTKPNSLPRNTIYLFTRVHKDYSKVWMCGWATDKTLQKPKYYKKKGESDDSGFTFKANGYHLPIRATRRFDSLPVC